MDADQTMYEAVATLGRRACRPNTRLQKRQKTVALEPLQVLCDYLQQAGCTDEELVRRACKARDADGCLESLVSVLEACQSDEHCRLGLLALSMLTDSFKTITYELHPQLIPVVTNLACETSCPDIRLKAFCCLTNMTYDSCDDVQTSPKWVAALSSVIRNTSDVEVMEDVAPLFPNILFSYSVHEELLRLVIDLLLNPPSDAHVKVMKSHLLRALTFATRAFLSMEADQPRLKDPSLIVLTSGLMKRVRDVYLTSDDWSDVTAGLWLLVNITNSYVLDLSYLRAAREVLLRIEDPSERGDLVQSVFLLFNNMVASTSEAVTYAVGDSGLSRIAIRFVRYHDCVPAVYFLLELVRNRDSSPDVLYDQGLLSVVARYLNVSCPPNLQAALLDLLSACVRRGDIPDVYVPLLKERLFHLRRMSDKAAVLLTKVNSLTRDEN